MKELTWRRVALELYYELSSVGKGPYPTVDDLLGVAGAYVGEPACDQFLSRWFRAYGESFGYMFGVLPASSLMKLLLLLVEHRAG